MLDIKKIRDWTRTHELLLLIAVLIIFFVFQSSAFFLPAYNTSIAWRDSDTYSIALNYFQYDMNPFHPQFNYDGVSDIYVQLELQIVPYITAVIFKVFNRTSIFIPRVINTLLFAGSAWYLYRIERKYTKQFPALAGVLIYLFMPISAEFSHSVMPESCAVFFYCGAVFYLLDWYMDNSRKGLWLSAVFMAFAIMEKIPAAFAGILVIAALFWKFGAKCIGRREFWGYGAISLGLPAIYYGCASLIASSNFVDGIAAKHIFTEEILAVFTKAGVQFFKTTIPTTISMWVVVPAIIGLCLCLRRDRMPLFVWAAAMLLELATIVAVIKFDYYLIFIAPVAALLCAIVFEDIWNSRPVSSVVCFVLIFTLLMAQTVPHFERKTKTDWEVANIASVMQSISEHSDVFVIGCSSPVLLNAADRHGYRANIAYYDYIPTEPEAELQYFIDHGAKYFVVKDGAVCNDGSGEYLEYLSGRFELMYSDQYCDIYDLRADK